MYSKMKVFLAIFAAALSCILAQKDPTTVCFPDQLTALSYDFETGMAGNVYLDYIKGELAIVEQNFTLIYDLKAGEEYAIDANGDCQKGQAPPLVLKLVGQCLPADARLLTNMSSTVGMGSNSLQLDAWEIDLDGGLIVRVGFTATDPAVPVIREVIGGGALDVMFFLNPVAKVEDPSVFNVPVICPDASVVG